MHRPEATPRQLLRAFDRLDRVLVDASSIIYMEKAGFLEAACRALELCTIPEVVAETGHAPAGMGLVAAGEAPADTDSPADIDSPADTDGKILALARERGLPVLAEDRKILQRLKGWKIPYFNSLMILNLLLYKKEIDEERYNEYHGALGKIAWYSEKIWAYGREVRSAIESGPGSPPVPDG